VPASAHKRGGGFDKARLEVKVSTDPTGEVSGRAVTHRYPDPTRKRTSKILKLLQQPSGRA
jgi:hypothetical protein